MQCLLGLHSLLEDYLVGVPGLEPGHTEPESAVLPLHNTPENKKESY